MELAVKDGYVYTGGDTIEADVGVSEGNIEVLGDVEDADRIIDASGCLVLPGLVNAHTHCSMTLLRGHADDLPLQTWLEEHVWPVEAHLRPDDIRAGARLAAVEMIRGGTTAFGDMYFDMGEVADVVRDSGLRARLGHGIITVGKDEEGIHNEIEEGVSFVEDHDGTADGRVQGMLCPHAPYTVGDGAFRELGEKARKAGVPLHTHMSETAKNIEDSLEANGLRPPEYLDSVGAFDGNAYVAHGVHLNEDDIRLLASKGVGVAHCPSANMKLASGVAPVSDVLDAGVCVGIATDGPASNNSLDMFKETRHAALIAKNREGDASAVPAETAIGMATQGGAELLGTGTGAIEEGRPADLTVVDLGVPHLAPQHDLVSHAVYAANAGDVTATVVDGEVLMEDGIVETMDEKEVLAEAEAAAEDLLERAGASE